MRLGEADLDAVAEATRDAEARCGGEIVTVVVDRCDDYEGALWKAAALGSVGTALVAAALHVALGLWGGPPLVWIALPALGGAGVGWGVARWWPWLHRQLIGEDVLARRVERRASVAFLQEELFQTRGRIGILVLVALFERRVEMLRDSGVEERVDPAVWEVTVARLAKGIREGRPGAALVECIREAGDVLAEHGFEAAPDEVDELPDRPRVHEK